MNVALLPHPESLRVRPENAAETNGAGYDFGVQADVIIGFLMTMPTSQTGAFFGQIRALNEAKAKEKAQREAGLLIEAAMRLSRLEL